MTLKQGIEFEVVISLSESVGILEVTQQSSMLGSSNIDLAGSTSLSLELQSQGRMWESMTVKGEEEEEEEEEEEDSDFSSKCSEPVSAR
jgi:hypothetical protein